MEKSFQQDYEDDGRQNLLEHFLYPVSNLPTQQLSKKIAHKTILITGASFGIGASLATYLSDFPVTLWLVARTKEKLEQLQNSWKNKPCKVEIFAIDLRDEGQINSFLQNRPNKIDIFINNAGKSIYRGLQESIGRFQDVQRCASLNYLGAVQLVLGLLPDLLAQKGHIINISTINARIPPTVGWSAYQSSKTAFDQWLRCLEPELSLQNVAVSTLYLPLVRTRMSMVNKQNRERPAMSKTKATRLILRYLISRKRIYMPWWLRGIFLINILFPNLWYKIQKVNLKK